MLPLSMRLYAKQAIEQPELNRQLNHVMGSYEPENPNEESKEEPSTLKKEKRNVKLTRKVDIF